MLESISAKMSKLDKAKLALLAMQRHPWEHGVCSQAFIDAGEETIALLLAHEAMYRQSSDGRLAFIHGTRNITDPCACGEAVMYAYKKTGDEAYLLACRRMLKYIDNAPRSLDNIQYHSEGYPMIAADCMYMVAPFYAVMGRYDEAVRQIRARLNLLWDADAGLMHHQWDDGKKTFFRAAYWGAATGWTAAAICRTLTMLPNEMHKEIEFLKGCLDMVVSGILKYQLECGLFRDILDDPGSFVETNCAQMVAYAIYRGCERGYLDEKYIPYADKMRAAANRKVDERGLVHGVSGAPSFDKDGFSPEGQAFYILMEAAADYYRASKAAVQ